MITTTINVSNTFRVRIDTCGNHIPESWKEAEEITLGKFKGQMSKPKWVSYESYYNNLAKAIRFGCEEGLLETGVEVGDNTSLGEYLKHLEGVYKKISEVCSAGK